MDAVAELFKAYYKNRDENPWHRIYDDIQTYWSKENPSKDMAEILLLLREAVFGALDILSFGLITEVSTPAIVNAMTSESGWNNGKRKVRKICLDIADELIAKGDVHYLMPTALKRDDFAFLVPRVEETQFESFKNAKPKISRGKVDLSKLETSLLGSRLLREQMIMETKLKANDPRVSALIEAYELRLVEIEVDRSTRILPPTPTDQTTLNGEILHEDKEGIETSSKKRRQVAESTPLLDFLETTAEKPLRKKNTTSVKRARRRKNK